MKLDVIIDAQLHKKLTDINYHYNYSSHRNVNYNKIRNTYSNVQLITTNYNY